MSAYRETKELNSLDVAENQAPLVLVFGGLDPSGAGLQADIETCLSLGCHALPIATGITVQNTRGLSRIIALKPADIIDQVRYLMAGIGHVASCKIGMLPDVEIAQAVAEALNLLPSETTVILDPVMSASAGGTLMTDGPVRVLPAVLLRISSLIKPNYQEARRLVGATDLDEIGRSLSGNGSKCRYALLTGTDEAANSNSRHYLYRDGAVFAEYRWPVHPGAYHGTGCTLATAIAAFCARGETMECAIGAAQSYTERTVRSAISIGGAQKIPNRLAGLVGDLRCQ